MKALISFFALSLATAMHGAFAGQMTYAFGEVRQGMLVEHEFNLPNETSNPLRITGVELTTPLKLERAAAVVPPGQAASLRVKLDTATLKGNYQGSMIVLLEGGTRREFAVEGRIVPPVEVLPHPAFFLSTARGQAKSVALEVVNRDETPLELSVVEQPKAGRVSVEPIESGRRYRLLFTVPADAPAGRTAERVALKTTNPAKPLIHVGVNTFVHERVHAYPQTVDLGTLRRADLRGAGTPPGPRAQTVMVYQASGQDFEATAQSDVPGLDIRVERGPAGDRLQMTISMTPAAIDGPIKGTIKVTTNDPAFSELRLPVTGTLLAD